MVVRQERYSWMLVSGMLRSTSAAYGEQCRWSSGRHFRILWVYWLETCARKFGVHERSKAHQFAVMQLKQYKTSAPINSQLYDQSAKDQANAQSVLLTIISSLFDLARQGIAMRGHEHDDGNFMKLLRLRQNDNQSLKWWMTTRHTDYTS